MARKTYIPGIKFFCNQLKNYIAKYKAKLTENLGEGAYTVIEFILDLVSIAVTLIEGHEDASNNYGDPLVSLSSQTINNVEAAIAKWRASNGLGGS